MADINPDLPLAREIQQTMVIVRRDTKLREIDAMLSRLRAPADTAKLAELRELRRKIASFPESLRLNEYTTVQDIRNAWPRELD